MRRQRSVSGAAPIGLFHTAQTNADLFARIGRAETPGLELQHWVHPDLLATAERAKGLPPALRADTDAAMRAALRQLTAADGMTGHGLICTCSTLGPIADDLAAAGLPVARADRALAIAARRRATRRLAVLVAVETTIDATTRLFATAAAEPGASGFDVIAIAGAWARFKAGDAVGYAAAIAEAVNVLPSDYDVVALAQANMADAVLACRRPALTVPSCALAAMAKTTGPPAD